MSNDPHKFTTLEMQALAECFPVVLKYTSCPTCGAQGEQNCFTSGGVVTSPHTTRTKEVHRILSIGWDEAVRLDVEAYLGA
jgi:hypothetical protein